MLVLFRTSQMHGGVWGTRTNILAVVGMSQAFWGTSTKQVANNTAYTTGTDTM